MKLQHSLLMMKMNSSYLSPVFRHRYSTEAGAEARSAFGSEAFRTMEQTRQSQSGGALELDDRVKTK